MNQTPFGINQPNMNMNNPMNMMQKFIEFKRNFQGDPKTAVMNLLNNGQMSQEQFNQLQGMANRFMNQNKW